MLSMRMFLKKKMKMMDFQEVHRTPPYLPADHIPWSPESLPMPDIPMIHLCWLRRVSHPYIILVPDDDRSSLASRLRRHIPDEVSVLVRCSVISRFYEARRQDPTEHDIVSRSDKGYNSLTTYY
ncbi:hypothetical protein LR48_Vigan10g206300 [Vigna angularis]|uniref:Uncharacterized protein n=1 Tax=Phaseolus angularis TaxID=3914 RepID=A0A0L9VM77_PHAAN|nr:hypothetical protein LR48_Vigan10g206300 [Vigna angularis]